MDISTTLCRVKLQNPTILASGILGVSGASMTNVVRNGGAGAVTIKSVSMEERQGHPCPVITMYEQGMINAVGLSSPGIEEAVGEIEQYRRQCDAPMIASVFSGTTKGFGEVTKAIAKIRPSLIEANLSCPNVEKEYGKSPALDPQLSSRVIRLMKKKTDIPIIAKLSPIYPHMKEMIHAVAKAGADIINLGNTAGPGMTINIEMRRPTLANEAGGVSGPAIFPIALRCVYNAFEVTDGKIPIIGTGGVTY